MILLFVLRYRRFRQKGIRLCFIMNYFFFFAYILDIEASYILSLAVFCSFL